MTSFPANSEILEILSLKRIFLTCPICTVLCVFGCRPSIKIFFQVDSPFPKSDFPFSIFSKTSFAKLQTLILALRYGPTITKEEKS